MASAEIPFELTPPMHTSCFFTTQDAPKARAGIVAPRALGPTIRPDNADASSGSATSADFSPPATITSPSTRPTKAPLTGTDSASPGVCDTLTLSETGTSSSAAKPGTPSTISAITTSNMYLLILLPPGEIGILKENPTGVKRRPPDTRVTGES